MWRLLVVVCMAFGFSLRFGGERGFFCYFLATLRCQIFRPGFSTNATGILWIELFRYSHNLIVNLTPKDVKLFNISIFNCANFWKIWQGHVAGDIMDVDHRTRFVNDVVIQDMDKLLSRDGHIEKLITLFSE